MNRERRGTNTCSHCPDSSIISTQNVSFQVENRTKEMRRQMEMVDIDGMTVLMHACSGSSSAAFRALSQCVEVSQVKPGSELERMREMREFIFESNAAIETRFV